MMFRKVLWHAKVFRSVVKKSLTEESYSTFKKSNRMCSSSRSVQAVGVIMVCENAFKGIFDWNQNIKEITFFIILLIQVHPFLLGFLLSKSCYIFDPFCDHDATYLRWS